jgi:hypothetical protein
MLYILDSNILIHPNRTTHPFDIHPTFWEKMSSILNKDDIASIDKVKYEIYNHEDDLTNWCKSNIPNNFWNSTANSINEYAEIQNWAQSRDYNERALADFADYKNADPFLVSFALHAKRSGKDITIVTQEISSPESKRTVKLPDVCIEFEIQYKNINNFFREINARF